MVLKLLKKPLVHHIYFFADDGFLFHKANLRETIVIKELQEDYCEISGQLINLHKSVVYFIVMALSIIISSHQG